MYVFIAPGIQGEATGVAAGTDSGNVNTAELKTQPEIVVADYFFNVEDWMAD